MNARFRTTIAAASSVAALSLAAAGPAAASPPPQAPLAVACHAPEWVLVVRGEPVANLPGRCADGQAWSWGASNSGGGN